MKTLVSLGLGCWLSVGVLTGIEAQDTFGQHLMSADVQNSLHELCSDCHSAGFAQGSLNVDELSPVLNQEYDQRRWVLIHDRIQKHEMPPDSADLPDEQRQALLGELSSTLAAADRAAIAARGRGPLRRLNRDEYEQNLRDLLRLPDLDIRDKLPEDREQLQCNKVAEVLDVSRVQLAAQLEAAEAALRQAMVDGPQPLPQMQYRASGTRLFAESYTYGEREAMFFARDNRAVDIGELAALEDDSELELALFRSAHWPYYGYPKGFVAKFPGTYRLRFSARSVLQQEGYRLEPAVAPVPMTFRARKPSGPDVSGDVRATGGWLDIGPESQIEETTIRLMPGETFEYSLLGLPVPLARNVDGGPPSYRFPPFPAGGQPGVAIKWLEIEGPLPPASWPPPSHRVLFGDLTWQELASSKSVAVSAERLLRRFLIQAAREPLSEEVIDRYQQLVEERLEAGDSLPDALLVGYRAFLCSGHFLYLREPEGRGDAYAIASRLSHFLTNSRPDQRLMELARSGQLAEPETLGAETNRLIRSPEFSRFVESFTGYWLSLRNIRRDEPDIRLYPEYRFDDYLVESMMRETQAFVAAMVRDNLPARSVVKADFALVNDRLSRHYELPPVTGSSLQRVELPADSPRGGLLTQAAIMKVTANGSSTSPVVRGAWVMERLLGQPPPPPPPSVPAVEPDIRGAETIRELLELHTESSSCAACHAQFDPVGLALENFDIWGGWRTRYRGVEIGEPVRGIDRAGHDFQYTLTKPVEAGGRLPDGRRFDNLREFKAMLAEDDRQLARNLLQRFTLYSTGTPVRFSERQLIEQILDACADQGYRVGDLVRALVQSPIFVGGPGE